MKAWNAYVRNSTALGQHHHCHATLCTRDCIYVAVGECRLCGLYSSAELQYWLTGWCIYKEPQAPREREGPSGNWPIQGARQIGGTATSSMQRRCSWRKDIMDAHHRNSILLRAINVSIVIATKSRATGKSNIEHGRQVQLCHTQKPICLRTQHPKHKVHGNKCSSSRRGWDGGRKHRGAWGEVPSRTKTTKRCVYNPIPPHWESFHTLSHRSWFEQKHFTGPRGPLTAQSCLCCVLFFYSGPSAFRPPRSWGFRLRFAALSYVRGEYPPSSSALQSLFNTVHDLKTYRLQLAVNRMADLCKSECVASHAIKPNPQPIARTGNTSAMNE